MNLTITRFSKDSENKRYRATVLLTPPWYQRWFWRRKPRIADLFAEEHEKQWWYLTLTGRRLRGKVFEDLIERLKEAAYDLDKGFNPLIPEGEEWEEVR